MSGVPAEEDNDVVSGLRKCILDGYILDISSCVRPDDLIIFTRGAREAGLIRQRILDDLSIVDPSIPHETRCRYLMLYIGKTVIANEKLGQANKFHSTIQLLSKYLNMQEINSCLVKSVDTLDVKLKPTEVFEMCIRPETTMNVELYLNRLYESLSDYRHSWEKIGLALQFSYDDLKNIKGEHNHDIDICLHKLLHSWLSLEHHYVKPPTFGILEEVLSSKLVGLRGIVDEVKKKLRNKTILGNMDKYNIHTDNNILTYSSSDIIISEPSKDIVVLIEVRVKCQDPSSIEYKWSKDRNALKPSDFLILGNSILCIHVADIRDEGKYQCMCKLGKEMIESNPIEVKMETLICKYRQRLVRRYNIEPEVKQDTWHKVQQNTYINLAVIGGKGVRLSKKCYQQTIRGDADDVFSSKASIEYQEAFRDIEYGDRVFVVGRPGSGKTTLVHKISKDWAKGSLLGKYKALFLVYLRGFHNNPNVSLKDLVKCYFRKQEDLNRICEYIEEHEGLGVCFILDGLDEYQPEGKAFNFIFQLIEREELPCATVIVASRPAAVAMFDRVSRRQVEVLGFFKEQIKEYIKFYEFTSDLHRSNLTEYLSQHSNIHHMCYLPIQSAMVCFLFDECEGTLPNTETGIYEEFTKHTLLRALYRSKGLNHRLQSLEDLEDTEMSILLDVCKLAHKMTISSIQVIQHDQAELFYTNTKIEKTLGLITKDEKATNCGFENLYSFFHLTFQEFLAAYHISRREMQEQLTIIKSEGPKKHMYMVFKFYCGLTEFKENDVRFKTLIKVAKFNIVHTLQCCYESQQPDMCNLVAHNNIICIDQDFKTPSDYTCLGYFLMNARRNPVRIIECSDNRAESVCADIKYADLKYADWECFDLESADFECAEAFVKATRNTGITRVPIEMWVSLFAKDLSCPMMHRMHVSPSVLLYDMDVEEFIPSYTTSCRSQSDIELVAIEGWFELNDWEKLLKQIERNCKDLRIVSLPKYKTDYSGLLPTITSIYCYPVFSFANIAFRRAEILLMSYHLKCELGCCCETYDIDLGHTSCLCTHLSLFNCNVNDERAALLAEGLKHNSSVEVLELVANDIGDEGAMAIASGVTSSSHLRYLDLSLNKIGDEGAKALMNSSRTINWNLFLFGNLISNCLIAEIDRKNSIELFQTLDVSYSIKLDGLLRFSFLVNEWSLPLSTITILHTLYLQSLNIDENDTKVLVKMLSEFTCLYSVSLVDINIRTDSMKLLSNSLVWGNVHILNLSYNSIEPEGTTHLCQAMKGISHQILTLNLGHNNIGVEGALAVAECLQVSQSLCELNLSYNDIQDTGTEAICESLKSGDKLQVLNLGHNNIGVEGALAVAECLQVSQSLCELDLSYNDIQDTGTEAICESLKNGDKLQVLNLASNCIEAPGCLAIAILLEQHGKSLITLDLSCNRLIDVGAVCLARGLRFCSNLQKLHLSDNYIGYIGIEAVAEVFQDTDLTDLILEDNINNEGEKALASLQSCNKLTTLSLSNNVIGDVGAGSLGEGLSHCSKFHTLKINDNLISGSGAISLAEGVRHCHDLNILELGDNFIVKSDLKPLIMTLKECKELKSLYVRSELTDIYFNTTDFRLLQGVFTREVHSR